MMCALLTCLALAGGVEPNEMLTTSARLDTDALELGGEYEIVLSAASKEGYSTTEAGIPGVILQIDVPPSVRLSGQVLKSHEELKRNEFLREPFERLLKETPARIGFKLIKRPQVDEAIGLNLLAYVGPSTGDGGWFVRQRLMLPLTPNAEARIVPNTESSWGQQKTLRIGATAAAFSLPRADGSKVSLDQYRGEKNVVVMTYRAHW